MLKAANMTSMDRNLSTFKLSLVGFLFIKITMITAFTRAITLLIVLCKMLSVLKMQLLSIKLVRIGSGLFLTIAL